MSDKLVQLHDGYVMRCPCGSDVFYILVDEVGVNFGKILGFQCTLCELTVADEVLKKVKN